MQPILYQQEGGNTTTHGMLVGFSVVVYCVFGTSLSKPHTSETALQDACICMSGMTDRPYTEYLNWMNGYEIYTRASAS